MLVYDPQTNGAGWIVMRGVPSSLTAVELWSTSDLGNFYACPSVVPVVPKPSQHLPLETTVAYVQTEAESPRSTSAGLDRFAKWDTEEVYTEEVQDWSHAPSPPAVTTVPLWGEAVGQTPSVRQNRCLVSECFTEPGVGSPHKYTPEAEKIPPTGDTGKTPLTEQVEDVSADEQEPAHIVA